MEDKLETIVKWIAYLSGVFLIVFVAYCIVQMTHASGKIESCYIQYDSGRLLPTYIVYGRREWRHDYELTVQVSPEDAYREMKRLCPVSVPDSVEGSTPSP